MKKGGAEKRDFHSGGVEVNGLTARDWERLQAGKSEMNGEIKDGDTDQTMEVIGLGNAASAALLGPGPELAQKISIIIHNEREN